MLAGASECSVMDLSFWLYLDAWGSGGVSCNMQPQESMQTNQSKYNAQ